MLDPESPWRSPEPMPVKPSTVFQRRIAIIINDYGFVALPLLGGFTGLTGYVIEALVSDSRRDKQTGPFLSYGQQAFFFSLPICMIICAVIGFAFFCAMRRRYVVALMSLVSASITGFVIIDSLWNDQITRYGRDPSEIALYYPPAACVAMAMVAAVCIGFLAIARSPEQVN